MPNELAGLAARHRESQTVNHIVQAPLQLLEQDFAGDALGAKSLLEVVPELAFLREIHALGFLLFTQLQTVANDFGLPVLPVLSGSEVSLFDGALVAKALAALQEQLDAFTTA
jgi:hypothetical protein